MSAPTKVALKPYGVECVGHSWATCPAWFETQGWAIECANRMASDAMRVTVYDCTSGPVGVPVLVIERGLCAATGAKP